MVELAEMLVKCIGFADWAFFAKNGGDATFLAVRMARAQTGRRCILRAPGSYHGVASLWREGSAESLRHEGVLPTEVEHIVAYKFNDIDSVREAVERCGDDFAGAVSLLFARSKWV